MPPSKKPTLSETLRTIAAETPLLRQAGVQAFTVEGVTVHLHPHVEPRDVVTDEPRTEFQNPEEDPSTYGLTGKNARPPGRRRVVEEES